MYLKGIRAAVVGVLVIEERKELTRYISTDDFKRVLETFEGTYSTQINSNTTHVIMGDVNREDQKKSKWEGSKKKADLTKQQEMRGTSKEPEMKYDHDDDDEQLMMQAMEEQEEEDEDEDVGQKRKAGSSSSSGDGKKKKAKKVVPPIKVIPFQEFVDYYGLARPCFSLSCIANYTDKDIPFNKRTRTSLSNRTLGYVSSMTGASGKFKGMSTAEFLRGMTQANDNNNKSNKGKKAASSS